MALVCLGVHTICQYQIRLLPCFISGQKLRFLSRTVKGMVCGLNINVVSPSQAPSLHPKFIVVSSGECLRQSMALSLDYCRRGEMQQRRIEFCFLISVDDVRHIYIE